MYVAVTFGQSKQSWIKSVCLGNLCLCLVAHHVGNWVCTFWIFILDLCFGFLYYASQTGQSLFRDWPFKDGGAERFFEASQLAKLMQGILLIPHSEADCESLQLCVKEQDWVQAQSRGWHFGIAPDWEAAHVCNSAGRVCHQQAYPVKLIREAKSATYSSQTVISQVYLHEWDFQFWGISIIVPVINRVGSTNCYFYLTPFCDQNLAAASHTSAPNLRLRSKSKWACFCHQGKGLNPHHFSA